MKYFRILYLELSMIDIGRNSKDRLNGNRKDIARAHQSPKAVAMVRNSRRDVRRNQHD
jgi:hypothetical protein